MVDRAAERSARPANSSGSRLSDQGEFEVNSDPFNPELARILDRVYGMDVTAGAHREESLIAADRFRMRRQRDAEALEEALEGLRQLRERSQGLSGIKEEIDYLRGQIVTLRALGDEIARLRAELARPPGAVRGVAAAQDVRSTADSTVSKEPSH